MLKIKTWISVFVFLLLGFASCSTYSFQSETAIKQALLRDVPIGSSSAKVLAYLRHKTGKEQTISRNFLTSDDSGTYNLNRYYHGAIYCNLASYGQIFLVGTEVDTRWEFDAKDRLISLRVTKQAVGP